MLTVSDRLWSMTSRLFSHAKLRIYTRPHRTGYNVRDASWLLHLKSREETPTLVELEVVLER